MGVHTHSLRLAKLLSLYIKWSNKVEFQNPFFASDINICIILLVKVSGAGSGMDMAIVKVGAPIKSWICVLYMQVTVDKYTLIIRCSHQSSIKLIDRIARFVLWYPICIKHTTIGKKNHLKKGFGARLYEQNLWGEELNCIYANKRIYCQVAPFFLNANQTLF